MKNLKQVLEENPDYKKLINAVIYRIGIDSINDVNNFGVTGGFPGFIYYVDTINFFNRHRKDILKLAEEQVCNMGENTLEMIQQFNCFSHFSHEKNKYIHKYTIDEIAKAIYAGKGDLVDQIKNGMAWFAAEEVCRMFED